MTERMLRVAITIAIVALLLHEASVRHGLYALSEIALGALVGEFIVGPLFRRFRSRSGRRGGGRG
jgi:hypothetical protein